MTSLLYQTYTLLWAILWWVDLDQVAPIAFSQENIHVIRSADGRQADDISTEADHVAMADFILSHIKRLTDDQNTVIHASLAGGRKTMTFFMGYALSLYGRVCDTLSHVLVTDGFESLRDFYYPTPYDHTLPGRNNNELLNAKDARVTLTDIPFVRLRDEIPQSLIAGQASYAQVIERLNLSSRPLFLVIDLPRCQLICSDIDIPMAPINLAFYLWFVERHLQNMPPLEVPPKGTKDKIYASEFLRQYRKVVDAFKADDAAMTGLKDGMSHDYFSERKSRVMRDLKHYLGEELAKRYGIQVLDRRGRYQRFGLAIPRDKLSVNDH